ncbi:MAG: hypothetical protein GC155_14755 [Alphaproteobacteria bacterium]|nr:hypothetical protein [Alphaproteobacteria bacterium]
MNKALTADHDMMRRTVFTLLALLLATGFANAADKPDAKPTTPTPGASTTTNVQVIAYYFHGTVRCETCQKIERQAREIIEQRFKTELAAKRIVFKPVNYDLKENAHFQTDYKLPCPSLVLVRQKDGKDEKWKLLDETWQLVEDTKKFNRYVEAEVLKFLPDAK